MQPLSPFLGWYMGEEAFYEDLCLLFTVEGDRTEENLLWFKEYRDTTLIPLLEDQEVIYLAVSEVLWL